MKATLKLDNEAPVRLFGNVNGCIDRQAKEALETDKGIWEVDEETFADDAVIFDKSQVKQVSILNEEGEPQRYLGVQDSMCRHLESNRQARSFHLHRAMVWYPRLAEYDGEFQDKYLMNRLQPGASFMSEYIIRIEK